MSAYRQPGRQSAAYRPAGGVPLVRSHSGADLSRLHVTAADANLARVVSEAGVPAEEWQLLCIPVPGDIAFKDAMGNNITDPFLRPGAVIRHWADPDLARAWFQRAYDLAFDQHAIDSLNALGDQSIAVAAATMLSDPGNATTGPFVRTMTDRYNAQIRYVADIVQALANGHNALNILWFEDPVARWLYRYWISGPPADANAVFLKDRSYGGAEGWYTGSFRGAIERFPIIPEDNPPSAGGAVRVPGNPGGVLARRAWDLYHAYWGRDTIGTHPLRFVPTVGLTVSLPIDVMPNGSALDDNQALNVTDYPFIVNQPFVLTYGDGQSAPGQATFYHATLSDVDNNPHPTLFPATAGLNQYPFNAAMGSWRNALDYDTGIERFSHWDTGIRIIPPSDFSHTSVVDRFRGPSDSRWTKVRDWRQFNSSGFMDVAGAEALGSGPQGGTPVTVWLGAYDYLPYLRAWTEAIVNRSMERIILETRSFVMYQNNQSALTAGSAQNFLEDVLNAPRDVASEQGRPDNVANAAAAATMAIGAALSTVTWGISAIIGGIAAAALMGYGNRKKDTPGIGRDDLGRMKPTYERAIIGGHPDLDSPLDGPPNHYHVPMPPTGMAGVRHPEQLPLCNPPGGPGTGPGSQRTQTLTQPGGGGSMGLLVVAGAAVALGLMLFGKKSKR